jgi:hypothetical protein
MFVKVATMPAPRMAVGCAGLDVETGIPRFIFALPDGESGESRLHVPSADDRGTPRLEVKLQRKLHDARIARQRRDATDIAA